MTDGPPMWAMILILLVVPLGFSVLLIWDNRLVNFASDPANDHYAVIIMVASVVGTMLVVTFGGFRRPPRT